MSVTDLVFDVDTEGMLSGQSGVDGRGRDTERRGYGVDGRGGGDFRPKVSGGRSTGRSGRRRRTGTGQKISSLDVTKVVFLQDTTSSLNRAINTLSRRRE